MFHGGIRHQRHHVAECLHTGLQTVGRGGDVVVTGDVIATALLRSHERAIPILDAHEETRLDNIRKNESPFRTRRKFFCRWGRLQKQGNGGVHVVIQGRPILGSGGHGAQSHPEEYELGKQSRSE